VQRQVSDLSAPMVMRCVVIVVAVDVVVVVVVVENMAF
jgi:hypothetical protein